MEGLFKLKSDKDNIHILAFQYNILNYSIGVLKNRKKELRADPILNSKIENYLLMERLSIQQELSNEELPFDIKSNAKDYINNPRNRDLKNYMNICNHIIAKQLDIADLCSRVDFLDHMFTVNDKDLFCVDCALSTEGLVYTDVDKNFLLGCAKRRHRIVDVGSSNSGKLMPMYQCSFKSDRSNLINVAQ